MSGILNVTILGDSMYPTLTDGQTVSADILNEFDDVRIGDIVVLLHPFKPETHIVKRIKSFDGLLYFVEGDQPDPMGSEDSHNFGPVGRDLILARITVNEGMNVAPEFIEILIDDQSMSPKYTTGDTVIAHLLDAVDEIEIGDLVVCLHPENNEQQMIRRVKEIDGTHYFLAADNLDGEGVLDSTHFGTISREEIIAIIDDEAKEMERA